MTTTWSRLPEDLPEHGLVVEMRRIKEARGLSYGRLAALTHYSTSSWERFFNGKKPPTREAVKQLAEATGVDSHRLLALWELGRAARQRLEEAEAAQAAEAGGSEETGEAVSAGESGQAASRTDGAVPVVSAADVAATPAGEPAPAGLGCAACGRPHRRARRFTRQWAAAGGAVAMALVVGLLTGFLLGAPGKDKETKAGPSPTTTAQATPQGPPGCRGAACDGKDVMAMGCHADGKVVRTTYIQGVRVELRLSPSCRAVWGRISNGMLKDSVRVFDGTGREQAAAVRWGQDTYTAMVATDDAEKITVCGAVTPGRNGQPYEEVCAAGSGQPAATASSSPSSAGKPQENRR